MLVLIIDDHPLFRAGVSAILAGLSDLVCVRECESCEQAMDYLSHETAPSLILLDLQLPGIDGLSGLDSLKGAAPSIPIVILSANEDNAIMRQAITAGARGYIPKSAGSEVILGAVRVVLGGGVYLPLNVIQDDARSIAEGQRKKNAAGLTPREIEVLQHLARGQSNKQIADKLNLAENTVRVHVASILKQLGVRNRTEACYRAAKIGLIAY